MQINLSIDYTDGTQKKITALPVDLMAFESQFDLPITRLEKEVRLTHMLFIAWHVEKRSGSTGFDLDKWAETIAGIGVEPVKK